MSQLTIYKASAGSGKTFSLTREFLNIIFKYPENYRRILAVTFTNKATAEMKNRIISELNKLAKGIDSAYIDFIKKEYQLSEHEIKTKANKILTLLLHDFSKFSVNTIDKFFQKVIRSFTREVGIQPGYSIELNQKEILHKVIDELLLDIDTNNELKEWLSDFASDNIKQGGKWDFKNDIQRLAGEIFKEEFKAFDQQLIAKMSDKEFLKNYLKTLQEIKAKFENTMESIATKALNQIKSAGLTIEDFKWGKSSVPNYFNKVIQKDYEIKTRTINGTEDYKEWLTQKSEKKDIIEQTLDNGLFYSLSEIVDYYENNKAGYYTSSEILKFIHTLGILTDISKKLYEYCKDQNIFLISDASKIIQIIVDDNDSSFIYEKIGNRYWNYMIDEFQDTSTIQWHNFKPLIGNSLAQGSKNLVVGDVKQSIYRWRNSDWKILSDHIQEEFKQFDPEALSLNTNWRSKKNVIDFNNTIFCYSSQILQNQFNGNYADNNQESNMYQSKLTEAYQDVYQLSPSNPKIGGYINHTFLKEEELESWKEESKNRTIAIIEELQYKGYQMNDIAILVRSKHEGQDIANSLIEHKHQQSSSYKYDFISNDSLFLSSSSLIQFIIAILQYILNPDDNINLSYIAYEYLFYLNHTEIDNSNLHEVLKNKTKKDTEIDLEDIFPAEFIDSVEQIKQLPIYELVDRLTRIFKLNEIKSELPYLTAFLDLVLDFGKRATSDIHSFLNWWDEDGINKTLAVSEDQDAIRIITIHKSKGLEFKNVIIPFCNWEVDHKTNQTNILWCKTDTEPFSQLDLIPVNYSKNLLNTVFENDYLKEKFHAYVDNLNLLYVAFTRAEENLFCFSPFKKEPKSISRVNDLLYFTYKNYQNYSSNKELIELNDFWNTESFQFELGNLNQADSSKNEIPNTIELSQFESFDIKNKLRLKLHDNSFFTGSKSAPFEKVNHGKIMHEVFENITTEEDIPKAIDKLIFEGKISPNEKDTITQNISKALQNEQIKNWFSNDWQVKNEAEIILPNGKTARPDRVISNGEKTIIIDYKFGEIEDKKHHEQVKSYINMVREMEQKEVEGFLWYVDLGNIVAVSGF